MARTSSTMMPLGTLAPDFSLENVDGRTVSLGDFSDAPVLVVMFICNHCPFVKHIASELSRFGKEAIAKGGAVVAINANDPITHPADSPMKMREEVQTRHYSFPYLFDETQNVARAYGAACTPDFFVFDRERKLVYRGQFDGSRPGNDVPVTGEDLRRAVSAVLDRKPISGMQLPSIGCSIKWRPGTEASDEQATA